MVGGRGDSRTWARLGVGATVLAGVTMLSWPSIGVAGVDRFGGHLSIGYARLFVDQAPGGSFSIAAGLDHPVADGFDLGLGVGFHLLGSRTIERGSLLASLDYSLFELVALAHWSPSGWGPIGRLSAGPALLKGRAEQSGGGAGFSDLGVDETSPGAALDITVMQRQPAPVRVGLQLGTRIGFLPQETWTLATARVAIHY